MYIEMSKETTTEKAPYLHPNKQAFSSGAALEIFAQEISASTVYSLIVEHPVC